jgi:hypothetical protein
MNENVKLEWGREGLHVSQDGREVAVVDVTELSIMGLDYGADLDATPPGWFCSRRERVLKWLAQNERTK